MERCVTTHNSDTDVIDDSKLSPNRGATGSGYLQGEEESFFIGTGRSPMLHCMAS